jgi:hypothetical protein
MACLPSDRPCPTTRLRWGTPRGYPGRIRGAYCWSGAILPLPSLLAGRRGSGREYRSPCVDQPQHGPRAPVSEETAPVSTTAETDPLATLACPPPTQPAAAARWQPWRLLLGCSIRCRLRVGRGLRAGLRAVVVPRAGVYVTDSSLGRVVCSVQVASSGLAPSGSAATAGPTSALRGLGPHLAVRSRARLVWPRCTPDVSGAPFDPMLGTR